MIRADFCQWLYHIPELIPVTLIKKINSGMFGKKKLYDRFTILNSIPFLWKHMTFPSYEQWNFNFFIDCLDFTLSYYLRLLTVIKNMFICWGLRCHNSENFVFCLFDWILICMTVMNQLIYESTITLWFYFFIIITASLRYAQNAS